LKILVVYGTKYGSTGALADDLAAKLRNRGAEVDVFDIKTGNGLEQSSYDHIVLGSSIFVGSWTKEMQDFIAQNNQELNRTPLSYFVCCGDMIFGRSDIEECHQRYVIDAIHRMGLPEPAYSAVLGGFFDFSRYGLLVKAVLQARGLPRDMRQNGIDVSKPYDFRDWAGVEKLAESIMKY